METPTITKQDVEAAHRTLQVAALLAEYAKQTESTLDPDKMDQTVEVLRGLHSVLSMVHVHQTRQT